MIAAGLLLFLANPQNAAVLQQIADSGRVLQLSISDSQRLAPPAAIAPGAPPVLSFRFLEGKQRHRFGDLDLVIDDAGH